MPRHDGGKHRQKGQPTTESRDRDQGPTIEVTTVPSTPELYRIPHMGM